MERNHILARLYRAISGKSQEQFGNATGIHPITVANIERGLEKPASWNLESMAAVIGLHPRDGAELLRFCETLQQQRMRQEPDVEGLFEDLEETARTRGDRLVERLRRLPLPGQFPGPQDRKQAREMMGAFRQLDNPLSRLLLVRMDEDFQTWALAELVAQTAVEAMKRDLREARDWAELAVEIARRIRGTEGWRNRVLGFALIHEARVLKASGERKSSAAALAEAKKLWNAGSDPDQLLATPVKVPG